MYRVELNVSLNEDGTGTADSRWSPINLGGNEFSYPITIEPNAVMTEGVLEFNDRPIASDGTFTLDFSRVIIPGPANSITGRPIDAELNLSGELREDGSFCGLLAGEVFSPIMWDLTGSSIGMLPYPMETEVFDKDDLLFNCVPCGEDAPMGNDIGGGGRGGEAGQAAEDTATMTAGTNDGGAGQGTEGIAATMTAGSNDGGAGQGTEGTAATMTAGTNDGGAGQGTEGTDEGAIGQGTEGTAATMTAGTDEGATGQGGGGGGGEAGQATEDTATMTAGTDEGTAGQATENTTATMTAAGIDDFGAGQTTEDNVEAMGGEANGRSGSQTTNGN